MVMKNRKSGKLLVQTIVDWTIIGFCLPFGFYLNWPVIHITLLLLAVYYLLRPFSSKILITMSTISFLMIPLALGLRRQVVAGQVAELTFFLFLITIYAKFYEYYSNAKS